MSVPRRAIGTRVRRVGDIHYLARGPHVYELSELASLIWQLSDGTRSQEDIASEITAEYDVPPDVARRDLAQFLSQMTESGFIEV